MHLAAPCLSQSSVAMLGQNPLSLPGFSLRARGQGNLLQSFNSLGQQRATINKNGEYQNNFGLSTTEVFGVGNSGVTLGCILIGDSNTIGSSGSAIVVGNSNTTPSFTSTVILIGSSISGLPNNFVGGVFGGSSGAFSNGKWYFGSYRDFGSSTSQTILCGSPTNSNVVGTALILAPGPSTGNATPAVLSLQGSAVGSSGSTVQTLSTVLQVTNSLTMTWTDAVNNVFGTTTGTQHGTAASQKQSWWGATPVIQPASANQAALTDSTGGTPSTTLSDVGVAFSESTINNNFASLARLVNQLRNDLVTVGLLKGAS